jgi:adenylosuccinate lyase
MVQKNAFECVTSKREFKDALMSDPRVKRVLSADGIEACFDIRFYLRHIDTIFKNLKLG